MNQYRSLRVSFPVIFVLLLQSCASVFTPAETQIRKTAWSTHKVAEGIVWKYYHFDNLFDAKQSVTVLEVDPARVSTRVDHVDSGFFRTSGRASEAGAVAAINGSFFNTKSGGSVVFLKEDGVVITPPGEDLRAFRDNAGFAIDSAGDVRVIARPEQGWAALEGFPTVLSSGPLLLVGGEKVPQVNAKFNTNRHPRTAIGVTKRKHIVAVVVDGRSPEAYGMSTEELASLLFALGCADGMNLDGGGSSTAWVSGEPFNGVVNFPSDNKKFDHEGERQVSNCILFLPK